jgi:hypothetical protein
MPGQEKHVSFTSGGPVTAPPASPSDTATTANAGATTPRAKKKYKENPWSKARMVVPPASLYSAAKDKAFLLFDFLEID